MRKDLLPKISFAAAALALGAVALFGALKRSPSGSVSEASSGGPAATTSNPTSAATTASTSVGASSPAAPVPPASLARPQLTTASTSAPPPRFDYNKELESFANLKAKVFLNPEEKAERKRLLANVAFVRALEPLLKYPAPVGTELGQMQNQAIDLLLEAQAKGGQVAGEVMRNVIEDKEIENENADPQARRMLAGIKAEILYQWSAQEPARAADMERWLPGPVSQQIWQNVQAAQRQNLAESAQAGRTEAERAADRGH